MTMTRIKQGSVLRFQSIPSSILAASDDVPDPDASSHESDDCISQWFDDTESSLSSAHSGEAEDADVFRPYRFEPEVTPPPEDASSDSSKGD